MNDDVSLVSHFIEPCIRLFNLKHSGVRKYVGIETTPRRDEIRKFKSAINCVFLFLYCYFSVQDLPSNTNTAWEVAKKPFNKQKNRYGNIVTCTV